MPLFPPGAGILSYAGTGPITLENLAARIRELRTRAHYLERTDLDLVESRQHAQVELGDVAAVKAYVDALKALLSTGAIVAQKASLRSFLKRIEMNLSQVVTDYIILLKTPRNSTFGFFWLPLLQSRHGLRKEGGTHPGRGRL
jgi:hypothetical protein